MATEAAAALSEKNAKKKKMQTPLRAAIQGGATLRSVVPTEPIYEVVDEVELINTPVNEDEETTAKRATAMFGAWRRVGPSSRRLQAV